MKERKGKSRDESDEEGRTEYRKEGKEWKKKGMTRGKGRKGRKGETGMHKGGRESKSKQKETNMIKKKVREEKKRKK